MNFSMESLNLAYHGVRTESSGTTSRSSATSIRARWLSRNPFPQEITRAFVNLIWNGFYAVIRRKTEDGGSGFEPALRTSTKNLGNSVEIRIRDNGIGIPAEVKAKMFDPFFTTGLSW